MEDDNEWKEILTLIDDSRYLAAFQKYEEHMNGKERSTEIGASNPTIDLFLQRVEDIKKALYYEDEADSWILGNSMFGINTYYQVASDNNIILKLEGVMEDLPYFEQLAVIHEVDLYKEWVPFCSESTTIEKIAHAELVAYICLGIPMMLSRDFGVHAYGADCMEEHGRVLILGKSILSHPTKEIPFQSIGWLHNRMEIKEFFANIHVLSATSAKTVIIAHINPNAPLPQLFINYIMKHIAGIILYLFQRQVMKIAQDVHSLHAHRIRENTAFYRDWLLPKLRKYCEMKGWEQPTIHSLGEDGIPPTPAPATNNITIPEDS